MKIKLLCISTFSLNGKIKNISLNKQYNCKLATKTQYLIINDKLKPQLVDKLNFVHMTTQQLKSTINLKY
jgi:hypothetical protein